MGEDLLEKAVLNTLGEIGDREAQHQEVGETALHIRRALTEAEQDEMLRQNKTKE